MSWLDKVKTDLVIQTGDGKKFTPAWINANEEVAYQVTEFEFPDVDGTLVDRRKPKGSKFNLQVFFQGEDHLDQLKEFKESAAHPRFWIITHPYYDIINVQPLSLGISNEKYNVSSVSIPIVQTITDVHPKTTVIIEDKIEEDSIAVNAATSETFEDNVTPSSTDKKNMESQVVAVNANTSAKIFEDDNGQDFSKLINDANSYINDATDFAAQALASIQAIINFAAYLDQDLDSRIVIIKKNSVSYRSLFLGSHSTLLNITLSSKYMFESIGSTILATLCLAASRPFNTNDYFSRIKVVKVIDCIQELYDDYVQDLDEMQVGSGGNPNDYVANGENILALNNLVNFTMGNLFDLALEAKQERILALEDDSDIINIAHRLYGLEEDDSTIDELLRNNPHIGLNHILEVPKGTEITYYI
ncbi:MAG: hypothetical protein IMY67_11315 [Bacteroidetes bacterium]|nr:hypothetical protein [Bacteroidota bacterium]